MGEIYMIKNKIDGMMYVGQTKFTSTKRFRQHINKALNTTRNLHLYNAMRKYGIENFELIVLESDIDENMLDARESYYIEKYDTLNNGYNCTSGGGGMRNYHHSKETRKKMSIGISNSMWKINTPERAKKISDAQKGRKFTEEHKKHIKESIHDRYGDGNPFYGKHHTDDTKHKISDANTKYRVVQKSGEDVLNIFDSVTESAQYCIDSGLTSAKITSVMYRIYYTCVGNQKVCYGYNWEYLEKCIDYPENGSNPEDEQPGKVPTDSN